MFKTIYNALHDFFFNKHNYNFTPNPHSTKIFIAFFKNFLGFSSFRISVFHLTHVRTGVCQATPLRKTIRLPDLTHIYFMYVYSIYMKDFAWWVYGSNTRDVGKGWVKFEIKQL